MYQKWSVQSKPLPPISAYAAMVAGISWFAETELTSMLKKERSVGHAVSCSRFLAAMTLTSAFATLVLFLV